MKIAWKEVVVALVIGFALGGFAALRYCPVAHRGAWDHSEKSHPGMMDQFSSKLSLNAEQKERISAILEETRGKMDALRKEARPKFEEIRNSSRARIRELLNPDQQKKFEVMSAEMDARMEKRHSEWSRKSS